VLIACAAGVLVVAMVVLVARFNSIYASLLYVRERTGLDLPPFSLDLEQFDNFETRTMVCLTISPDRVQRLLRRADFVTLPPRDREIFDGVETLSPACRTLSKTGNVSYASGCPEATEWHAIVDQAASRIWVEVLYPDFSGDLPPCHFYEDPRHGKSPH
jgi:hypothetical protein